MISYFQLPFFSMSSQIIVERGNAKFSSKLYKGRGDRTSVLAFNGADQLSALLSS